MEQNKKLNINKLSTKTSYASLAKAEDKLARLRKLTSEGAELGEELSKVVADMRQVAAPSDQPFIFTPNINDNEHLLRVVFRDCDDVKFRTFDARGNRALVVFLDGMTDVTLIEKNVLETLMEPTKGQKKNINIDTIGLIDTLITSASLTIITKAEEALEAVLTGNALVMIDGIAEAFTIGAVKHEKRSITEAKGEGTIKSPFDAFNEVLSDNVALIRRRSKDTNLKIKIMKVGARTKTAIALVYVANIVKPGLVEEVRRRIETINIDQVLLSDTIAEGISEHPWTPFPQTISTEKPERVVAAIYEGRVAIVVDNSAFTLIVPCTYSTLMQSTDDFTVQPVIGSLLRLTRHLAAFIAIYLPAVYIAIVSYHPGILPTALAISIAELRAKTPFPSFLEALIMEALLELFQEAIVRLPNKLAGAASVVGGFVIGTTVVQAGLVNPLLVVVTAVTAIASYSISNYNFGIALRGLRVPMFIMATVLGLYGVIIGALAITVHLCSLRSFGESWLGGITDITLLEDWKDGLVRFPAKFLRTRPKEIGAQERGRTGDNSG
ncbi:spore germination protein [Dendrosporobacter sp. 1207_IL3150]|uniref:spore germination protein n=1 Tax=Dendrosporobacter sp. 1207_IL3150 TaxID=3084054 RepID=UPI002FD8F880